MNRRFQKKSQDTVLHGDRGMKDSIHGKNMLFTNEAQGIFLAKSPSFFPPVSGCKIIRDFLSSVTSCIPQIPSVRVLNLGEMSFQKT